MLKLYIASLLCVFTFAHIRRPNFEPFSDEHIHYINHIAKTTWKAGRNFDTKAHAHFKRLLGVPDMARSEFLVRQLPRKEFERRMRSSELPESFDPRQQWPNCPSLSEIRDQGDCGSCWAFGAVEAMTDRICIQSKGKSKIHISAEDLLACCDSCRNGCQWGYHIKAWEYYVTEGIVSGGQYNSSEGCQPYEIPPCDHTGQHKGHLPPCNPKLPPAPECKKVCEDSYKIPYSQDKNFGVSVYTVEGEENIMQELVENGPVEAVFKVYDDFGNYQSGVYQHISGDYSGNHAVKILGYGVEEGTKYWLVANSWNPNWGDAGGGADMGMPRLL